MTEVGSGVVLPAWRQEQGSVTGIGTARPWFPGGLGLCAHGHPQSPSRLWGEGPTSGGHAGAPRQPSDPGASRGTGAEGGPPWRPPGGGSGAGPLPLTRLNLEENGLGPGKQSRSLREVSQRAGKPQGPVSGRPV